MALGAGPHHRGGSSTPLACPWCGRVVASLLLIVPTRSATSSGGVAKGKVPTGLVRAHGCRMRRFRVCGPGGAGRQTPWDGPTFPPGTRVDGKAPCDVI
eukprot:scaffold649_cov347-Pavlova_lutheri.AAC.141